MSNFRFNRHFILLLLTLVLFSCKKDKQDDPIDTNPTPSGPTAMTASVDGTGYTASEFNARKTTTGAMRISTSNGTESILLVVANFTGETSYNLNTSVSFATYSNGTDNFSTVSSGSGSGTLVISSYNQTNHTISGTFQFTAGLVGSPGNSITVTSGSFTNISVLVNVPQPAAGQAFYIENGILYTPDEARAYLTDHFRFVIEVDHDENRWKYNTYANPFENPTTYLLGILVRKSLATNTYQTAYNNPVVQITEYNESEQYVSGRIHLTTMDLDIRFHRLPISPSTPVASGQVVLTNTMGEINFDSNQFTFIGGNPTTYRLEALNGANQKIVLETTYGSLDLEPSHGFGRTGTLNFYEDASGPITYTTTGYWHSYPGYPGRNVGFISFDGTVKVKGYQVPL